MEVTKGNLSLNSTSAEYKNSSKWSTLSSVAPPWQRCAPMNIHQNKSLILGRPQERSDTPWDLWLTFEPVSMSRGKGWWSLWCTLKAQKVWCSSEVSLAWSSGLSKQAEQQQSSCFDIQNSKARTRKGKQNVCPNFVSSPKRRNEMKTAFNYQLRVTFTSLRWNPPKITRRLGMWLSGTELVWHVQGPGFGLQHCEQIHK